MIYRRNEIKLISAEDKTATATTTVSATATATATSGPQMRTSDGDNSTASSKSQSLCWGAVIRGEVEVAALLKLTLGFGDLARSSSRCAVEGDVGVR